MRVSSADRGNARLDPRDLGDSAAVMLLEPTRFAGASPASTEPEVLSTRMLRARPAPTVDSDFALMRHGVQAAPEVRTALPGRSPRTFAPVGRHPRRDQANLSVSRPTRYPALPSTGRTDLRTPLTWPWLASTLVKYLTTMQERCGVRGVLDESVPLFTQIAERLADEIADGTLAEGERVPSTNELAAYYQINPATAAKGINVLTDAGLLEKRRGIGMFVAVGARARVLEERRRMFAERYVAPLLAEAQRLAIDMDSLLRLIRQSTPAQGGISG